MRWFAFPGSTIVRRHSIRYRRSVLIAPASAVRSPVTSVRDARSLPARSTMRHVAIISFANVRVRTRLKVHIVCEREESRFSFVSAMCFSFVPCSIKSIPSRIVFTGFS